MRDDAPTTDESTPFGHRLSIFTVAFFFSTFWALRYSEASALQNEAATYFQSGIDILEGGLNRMLTTKDGTTFSDIGYPNFLSLGFLFLGKTVRSAQFLNALLFGVSATLAHDALGFFLQKKKAWYAGLLLAASPVLTSFSGKIYSEHLAIFGGMLCIWGFLKESALEKKREKKIIFVFLAATLGGVVLVLTKSSFYFLFLILIAISILRKKWFLTVVSSLIVLIALPVQSHLHRGTRGAIQIAAQTAKVELQSYPTVFKCSIYNLSLRLGEKIFPETEGACRPNLGTSSLPGSELGYEALAFKRVSEGFSYFDGVKIIMSSPVKYACIGVSTLFAAIWIEGFYPDPISNFPEFVRLFLWGIKVVLSTLLWIGTGLYFASAFRNKNGNRFAPILGTPILFVLLFQFNVPAEQRYFFPLIPILYMASAAYFFGARKT